MTDQRYCEQEIVIGARFEKIAVVCFVFVAAILLLATMFDPDAIIAMASRQHEQTAVAVKPILAIKEIATNTLSDGDVIVVGKIGVSLPIVTAETTNVAWIHDLLDSGAVWYPASARFGQIGQTILLGHSAPANWPTIKHDTAFSRINELVFGDTISVKYGGRNFSYSVVRTQIIKKGDDLSGVPAAGSSLLLVSCWPPGRDRDRIVVEAVLATDK